MSRPDVRVDWCSYKAARYAVMRWHYSRRMPKSRQVYLGVWEDDAFVGAIIFGLSVTPHLGASFGLRHTECAELTRVALRAGHQAPVSQVVAVAVRLLRRQSPGLRLLVSYADPEQGHVGAIYQALGWTYVGRSSSIVQYRFRGAWRNDTRLFVILRDNPDLRPKLASRRLAPKFKYVYPLDQQMREMVAPLAHPYPKRAGSIEGDASAIHAEERGPSPTPALQVPLL